MIDSNIGNQVFVWKQNLFGDHYPVALSKTHPGMSPNMGKVLGFALVH
jgi:hypothetical protein